MLLGTQESELFAENIVDFDLSITLDEAISEDSEVLVFHNDIHRLKWFIQLFGDYEKLQIHNLCDILNHKKNKCNALLLRFYKNFDIFFERSQAEAFDGDGFVWRRRHRNDSASNVVNYFSHDRSEVIDNMLFIESSNALSLPFFPHGENIIHNSSSGLYSSPFIGDLRDVEKLREFLRSSVNKWGMKFTKLSDVLKE